MILCYDIFFFFHDTSTTEIYTLSYTTLFRSVMLRYGAFLQTIFEFLVIALSLFIVIKGINRLKRDRKSTRLNSSHLGISYAVFCLKKKKKTHQPCLLKTENTHH